MMTRDEIINMALEADCVHVNLNGDRAMATERLERFAALVAAKEREACKSECADLLAVSARQARDGDPFEIGREAGHSECEAAIRARGQ